MNTIGIDPNACFSYGCTIGDGSDTDHLLLNFTSLSWLHNIEAFKDHYAIFHVDGTYKIIKNRFPVIVFGRSDVSGQFHPISIAIVSHETEDDYCAFFK